MKTLTHDKAIEQLHLEYEAAEKNRYTTLFLSALSTPNKSNGLYSYAAMKTFPKHDFLVRDDVSPDSAEYLKAPCTICSAFRTDNSTAHKYDVGGINHKFYIIEGLHTDNIYHRLYILQHINRLQNIPSVTAQDFDTFKEILLYVKNAESDMKIRDIQKQLKKASFYKQLVDQIKASGITKGATQQADFKIQLIFEALGVCGVLHTEKHKGPFYEYINLAVAPRSSHSSDWRYPVDFWRGKDGIDWVAFDYWFSNYDELKDIRK